ncbi:MAG: exonuclease domain-containing protein [Clostridia bacterium]|nr:exonuclease domain-containing protein [Clostridia bacterium]
MNYIVFDLELNSKAFKSRIPNEIIEIGAVKLNENLEIEGVFQSFVKPKIFRKLFPIIKTKTGISQYEVNEAESFKVVLKRFKEWIGEEYILCCWGHDDIHHMRANCQFNRRNIDWLKDYIDIQRQFSKIFESPPGQRYSLEKALSVLEIDTEEDLHRAFIDAKYTAEIFKRIFDKLNLKGCSLSLKSR